MWLACLTVGFTVPSKQGGAPIFFGLDCVGLFVVCVQPTTWHIEQHGSLRGYLEATFFVACLGLAASIWCPLILVPSLRNSSTTINLYVVATHLGGSQNFLFNLPEELWSKVITKISHSNTWFCHGETLHINLVLWIKHGSYDELCVILLGVSLGIIKRVQLVTYLTSVKVSHNGVFCSLDYVTRIASPTS